MLPFEDRYTRQRQVPEIGFSGQAALERSRAALPSDPIGEVASTYLRRAGVGQVIVSANLATSVGLDQDSSVTSPGGSATSAFRYLAPKQFALGCQLALAHITRQLRLRST